MTKATEQFAAIASAAQVAGERAASMLGGFLRCEECRAERPLTVPEAGSFMEGGWPKCCGYSMRWWTQRQIDAGEMPA